MRFTLAECTVPPDPDEIRPLLVTYYIVMQPLLDAVNGPRLKVPELVEEALAAPGTYLPPDGATVLARDARGRLIGCGYLRSIDATRGEMKRLFVLPEAQGTGLGRKLTQMRIDIARRLGLKELYADTVRGNDAMLGLYRQLGFEAVARYPGNANPVEYDPILVYRRLLL